MKKINFYKSFFFLTALLGSNAYSSDPVISPTPPEYSAVDANNVDLIAGVPKYSQSTVRIGTDDSQLFHSLHYSQNGFFFGYFEDNFSGGFDLLANDPYAGTLRPVYIGTSSERFVVNGSIYTSLTGSGSKLIDNQNGIFTYTKSDGTTLTIDKSLARRNMPSGAVTKIVYPNGRSIQINYKSITVDSKINSRIQSVVQSDGLMLKYNYSSNTATDPITLANWYRATKVTALNLASEYCAPLADVCALNKPWSYSTFTWNSLPNGGGHTFTVTDQSGSSTRYTMDNYSRVVGFKPSTSPVDTTTYSLCSHVGGQGPNPCYTTTYEGGVDGRPPSISTTYVLDKVTGVTKEGQSWSYHYPPGSPYARDYVSESPTGSSMSVSYWTYYTGRSPLAGLRLSDGKVIQYDFLNYAGKPTSQSHPEGGGKSFQYDARWNLTGITLNPKIAGSVPSIREMTAGYDADCTYIVKCNKPNWIKDAQQNQTDYAYNTVHGGVLSVTSPMVNGIRQQKRYVYAQRHAWVLNTSGTYVQNAPIWLLTQESYCKTGAPSGTGCTLASDEVLTTYDYGPNSGPNNLFLRGIAITADGETLRTCFRYDDRGNRLSETKPKAGLTSCP